MTTDFSLRAISESGYLRRGFADHYDAYRPAPPGILLDVLGDYAGGGRLGRVVDLGSGTGLSTRVWATRADDVVGIEANAEMLAVAEARPVPANVRYLRRVAHDMGLPDASADVVTCSQSFHWMDRAAALAEAARILRSGGVFAAYDYDFPPVVHPEVDAAYAGHLERRHHLRDLHGVDAGWTRTPKVGHLDAIRESGHFAYTREVVLHDQAEVGADEMLGFARSLGLVPELVALGVTEEELGLVRLEETVRRVVGTGRRRWLLGYRVRVGVRS